MPYRYVVDQVADESVSGLPRHEQWMLREFFRHLANHPSIGSDQQVIDASRHRNDVTGVGRLVVTYWIDHAAREVRIGAVEFL